MTLARRCITVWRERERERASIRQRRVWSWSSDIYKGAGRCGNSSIIFLVYSRFMSNHNRTGSPRERKSIGQRVTRSPRLGPWDIFKRARLVLLAHHAEPRIGIRVRASVSASFRDSLSLSLSLLAETLLEFIEKSWQSHFRKVRNRPLQFLGISRPLDSMGLGDRWRKVFSYV